MTYQITVQPSGRQFATEAEETILSAGIRAGVGLPYGCKDGACGSCKCKKISGTVVHGEHQAKALSPEEEANGFVLTCCAVAQSDVTLESRQVTDASAFPIKKMPARVAALEKKSADVMAVRLQLPATEQFRYHAGQYIEFILRDGSRRAYSMANAPHTQVETPGLDLHIRHLPGGKFTDHVFGAMKEKEIQRIEGPFGSFYLREDTNKPMVFVASGTGFAPIKALLEHIQYITEHSADPALGAAQALRPIHFYWGGRRPSDLYLDDWVKAQLPKMPQLHYIPVVSEASPEDAWQGRTGFVHQAVLDDFADLSGHQVYACGAPIVVNSAQSSFTTQRGLPEDEFFADSFTSEADKP